MYNPAITHPASLNIQSGGSDNFSIVKIVTIIFLLIILYLVYTKMN